jgi:hypothetical protein
MSDVSGTSDFTGWTTQDAPYSRESTRTPRVQKLFLTMWLEESSNWSAKRDNVIRRRVETNSTICMSQSTLPQRFCCNISSHHARVLRPFLRPQGSTVAATVQELQFHRSRDYALISGSTEAVP